MQHYAAKVERVTFIKWTTPQYSIVGAGMTAGYCVRGQQTAHVNADGRIDVTVRYPENDPEGAGQYVTAGLSNSQYGFIKEQHVDVDPALVMTLLGPDADMLAFTAAISPIVPRTGTGPYLDLVTKYQPTSRGSGCTGCGVRPDRHAPGGYRPEGQDNTL